MDAREALRNAAQQAGTKPGIVYAQALFHADKLEEDWGHGFVFPARPPYTQESVNPELVRQTPDGGFFTADGRIARLVVFSYTVGMPVNT